MLGALLGSYVPVSARSQSAAPSPLGPEFRTPREIKITDPLEGLKTIRVVSWNIDRGRQLDVVRSGLERERADLCLLQEVEFEELSQEHGQRAFVGQATLTRLPIRGSRILDIRQGSAEGGKRQNSRRLQRIRSLSHIRGAHT